jgi:AraC-like DNA-binding protein
MVNFYERVLTHPDYCRQFNCGDTLITVFNCPSDARMMSERFTSMWSRYNYIFYVLEGSKAWHTAHGSYVIRQGDCVFVRKGACILEQFIDIGFCLVLFFIPDEFVCEVLKTKSKPISSPGKIYNPVMKLHTNEALDSFFVSMFAYFSQTREPEESLLELKFKELILTLADNPMNAELLSYFCTLLHEPQSVSLQRVMDDNFCYNLKLEQYAELCNRSLSAFKRDFQKLFHTTPGKWLLEKKLAHAMHLLRNMKRTVLKPHSKVVLKILPISAVLSASNLAYRPLP